MSQSRKHLASAVVLCAFAAMAAGSLDAKPSGTASTGTPGSPASPAKPAEPEPARTAAVTVTARQLYTDYNANEVSADDKYKEKTLRVTGNVASIDKDFMGNIVVRLATSNEFSSVMATMQDSQKSKASALSKGNSVRVICEGAGMVVGTPVLEDCEIE